MELNNREIAALFWLLVSALVILRIGWMREGMLAFFKVIFMRRMMRWSLYMCGYLSLICYGLHMIELWSLAVRKLDQLDSVESLSELNIPPGNKLELLKGEREGQHSIRINDQYRICFRWTDSGPADVQIIDYH